MNFLMSRLSALYCIDEWFDVYEEFLCQVSMQQSITSNTLTYGVVFTYSHQFKKDFNSDLAYVKYVLKNIIVQSWKTRNLKAKTSK